MRWPKVMNDLVRRAERAGLRNVSWRSSRFGLPGGKQYDMLIMRGRTAAGEWLESPPIDLRRIGALLDEAIKRGTFHRARAGGAR